MRQNGDVMTASVADLEVPLNSNVSQLIVRNFYGQGLLNYQQTHEKMLSFTLARNESSSDEIWLLQHPKVFTQGQAGKAEHVLFAGDIPVIQSDRGGQVTYHGPGQLVAYIMVDIKRKGWGPRELVSAIENAIVATLKELGIDSSPKKDAPGVYVQQTLGDAKIASLGLRIKQGRSFHGLALNIDMDMEPFQRINPCGYAGMAMTQVKTELASQELAANKQVIDKQNTLFKQVSEQLKHHLIECLEYTEHIELPG
jgi:lipoyl(octanoyl) transferase